MEDSNQLEIDWGAPAVDGYASWQWNRQQAVRRIAELWGLPLGRAVRLRRRGIDGDFEGILQLASLPTHLNRQQPLELRMGSMTFSSEEVETCSVVRLGKE